MSSSRRLRRVALRSLGVALVAIGPGAASAAAAVGTGDPSANRQLSDSTWNACQADPSSSSCVSSALADINAARAAEGVRPMVLPTNFVSLTGAQQLLVLANLERLDRGLTPAILGLAAPLNQDAAAAAASDSDPQPSNLYGDAFSSNWAGGYTSTLETDFGWMYDDGVGSGNLDCSAAGDPGCWGHRHDILMSFDSPLVMGAAVGSGAYGTSMSELFVGGDAKTAPGQPDAPLAPTWATLAEQIPGATGAAATAAAAAPATSSAGGAGHGSTGPAATAGPRLVVRVTTGTLARGRTGRIHGTVSPGRPGRTVKLERRGARGWTVLATARLDRRSRFSFLVRGTQPGVVRLRVVLPGAAPRASSVIALLVS